MGSLILGIDPGASGALSGICLSSGRVEFVEDLPTRKLEVKARKAGFIKILDLRALTKMLAPHQKRTALVVIESPGAMPKQGLSSTFNFGKTCGHIEGILAALDFDLWYARPAVWKMALGLSRDKGDSIRMALRFYPEIKDRCTLKKHNDRAEAILLAHYGIMHLQPVLNLTLDIRGEKPCTL